MEFVFINGFEHPDFTTIKVYRASVLLLSKAASAALSIQLLSGRKSWYSNPSFPASPVFSKSLNFV